MPPSDCLDKPVRVELHPRPGKCPVPTEGYDSIDPRLSRLAEHVGIGAQLRRDANYCLDRLLHRSSVLNIKGRSYRFRNLEQAISLKQ